MSQSLPPIDLSLVPAAVRKAGDGEVKQAVSRFLDAGILDLDSATVERTRHGFVVRPKAVAR